MIDHSKVQIVSNWPTPTNLKEVRSFQGLVGYYRRFVEGFSKIAALFNALTQKGKKYFWSEECDQSFQQLKEKLTNAPILTLSDDGGEYYL